MSSADNFCKQFGSGPGTISGSRRGQGSGPHLKIHKKIGFPSNTGPDPLTNTMLPSQLVFLKGFFEKKDLEKSQQTATKA